MKFGIIYAWSNKSKMRFIGTGDEEDELILGLAAIQCAIKDYVTGGPDVSEVKLREFVAGRCDK